MNNLPLRLLLIDIANANDSINRKAFTGVSMFPAKHIQCLFKAKKKVYTWIDVWWSTWGIFVRDSVTTLRDWGGDDWMGRRGWSIFGLWELLHELACLCIERGFFVLEIAETTKEPRDTTDDTRGCFA